MIRAAAVAATDAAFGPEITESARAVLDEGGSAVDAVIAGFLTAAGLDGGVLLCPLVALVVGAGVGARAFDGRAVQPGRGAARPRGFVDAASVPDAARVAVPCTLAALTLLRTYRGRMTLRQLARPGVLAAEKAGASARAALLRRVGDLGALALRDGDTAPALLGAGGPVAGGVLTGLDLEEVLPAEAEARVHSVSGTTLCAPPWPVAEAPGSASAVESIVACDARGLGAALAYRPARNGILVPTLELSLGKDAVPVRRGIPRLAPGTPLPCPAPIAAFTRSSFLTVVALCARPSLDPALLEPLASGLPLESALVELLRATGAPGAVAASTDGKQGRIATLRP